MSSNELQRINAGGNATCCHAQRLREEAESRGCTMAYLHNKRIAFAKEFNVYAEATDIRGGLVHYRFLDGSVTAHAYIEKEE